MSTLVLANKSTSVRSRIGWQLRLRLLLLRGLSLLPTEGAVRQAVRLFCTPMPGTRKRALQADLSGAELVTVAMGQERLQAYVYGDPQCMPYVLAAHGWSSYGLRFHTWVGLLREAGFAVVCFDHVAHGRSSGERVSLPGFVDAALAIGRHFGPAYAGIGHSLGGAALAQAAVRGLRLQRLLLLAPAAEGEAAVERFVSRLQLGSHMTRRMVERFEQQVGEPMQAYHPEAAAAGLHIPLLVVHDVADTEVPWSEGERYALRTPGARMLTVEGLGHHRVVDAPEVLSAGMAFLQGQPVGERRLAAASLGARWS